LARTAEATAVHRQVLADQRLGRLVAVIVDRLRPEEIWLFGSRARGDARQDSDYDLFVVVPDDTPGEKTNLANTWELTRQASVSADVLAFRRQVFEQERDLIGTLFYTVAREGVLIYKNHGSPPNSGSPPITAGGRKPTVKDVIGRWLKRAQIDLTAIRNSLYGPEPSPESAAYHCQQAAEEIIKAGLIAAGVHPPKEHNLRELNALLPPDHPLAPAFRPLEALSAYITAFRYPDEPDIPVPSLREVEAWLAKLTEARDAVLGGARPET
jgi:predicted nucleotidyltransferase/HEPN domain-containing protein